MMTSNAQAKDAKIQQERDVVVARSSTFLSRCSKDAGLRYRKRALWIAAFYIPLLIVPWVLTCIMMYRPITLPSYISQKGAYSMTQIAKHENWLTAVDVLSRVATVLGVPVVSAILAQGAVVYAQRRKQKQSLTIRQLFLLADRGWVDPAALWQSMWNQTTGHPTSTLYVWLGTLLILITVVQPPIQSIVVSQEPKLIVTCNDNPVRINNDDKTCDKFGVKNKVIGFDPEPQELEKAPQSYIVHRTLQNIITVSSNDIQTRLWRENLDNPRGMMDTQRLAFRWIYNDPEAEIGEEEKPGDYYVSSILNGSDTGVLRQHAARMDSKAKCQYEDSFPEECSGDNPFTYSYNSSMTEVRVCAEGSYDKYPFTRSRNRQEISERIWFSLLWIDEETHRDDGNRQMENYTMSCEATTRRGWFELGNYQNGYNPSGMLEQWPSPEEMEEDFNDYSSTSTDNDFYPIEEEKPNDDDYANTMWDGPLNAFNSLGHVASGPLMMSALALFGNITYFHTAANTTDGNSMEAARDICESGRIPFSVYSRSYDNGRDILSRCNQWSMRQYEEDDESDVLMSYLVGGFMQTMEELEDAQRMLEITMFFANEALLAGTAEMGSVLDSRSIYSAPGYQVLKPQKTIAGATVISVLIALQVFGLVLLLRFIYSVPAWTGSFDADALVQIGGQLREQDQRLNIAGASGLVGIFEHDTVPSNVADEEVSDEGEDVSNTDRGHLMKQQHRESDKPPMVPLALGAQGVITKRSHKQTL